MTLRVGGAPSIPGLVAIGTAASTDPLLGYPERPGAFQALQNALAEGQESVAVQVLGDSTGNNTWEWVYQIALWLAAKYPAYTVKYKLFEDATQNFDPDVVMQTGPLGARYLSMDATNAGHIIPGGEISWFANDLDLRVLMAPTKWVPGGANLQTGCARWGNAGSRGFRFGLNTTGNLYYDYSTDGTNTHFTVSPATVQAVMGIADGAPLWIRVMHDLDNGAAGTTITFYASADGVTWTQIGAPVTTAGVVAAVFNPGNSQNWEIGSRGGTVEPFVGKLFEVWLCDGINGYPLNPVVVDAWQPFSSTAGAFGGSPQLTFVNASVPGKDVVYLSDATRFPKMTPKYGQAIVMLSCSHNDIGQYGPTYIGLWDTWLATIKARFPLAQTIVIAQNPRTAPALNIREHAIRRRQLISWAAKNSLALIDVGRAFREDGRPYSVLVDPADGIHPTVTGQSVWINTVELAITRRV